MKRRMQPVYFPEGNHRVLRGAWFVEQGSEWVPLKVSSGNQQIRMPGKLAVRCWEKGSSTDIMPAHGLRKAVS